MSTSPALAALLIRVLRSEALSLSSFLSVAASARLAARPIASTRRSEAESSSESSSERDAAADCTLTGGTPRCTETTTCGTKSSSGAP